LIKEKLNLISKLDPNPRIGLYLGTKLWLTSKPILYIFIFFMQDVFFFLIFFVRLNILLISGKALNIQVFKKRHHNILMDLALA